MAGGQKGFRALGGAAVSFLVLVACGSESPLRERVGYDEAAIFTNGDFETGTANQPPQSWTVATFLNPNPNGVTVQTPQTRAGLNLTAGGAPLTLMLNAAGGAESQVDPNLGAAASLRWPKFGNRCAVVNRNGNNQNVNAMSQTMTIGNGDVDPLDGQVHVRFAMAPVLQHPNHLANQQPYYFVQLTNTTTNTVLYSDFNLSGQPGVPWKYNAANTIAYTDWFLVDVAPGAGVAIGNQVRLEIIAAGCSLGAHWGYAYVDGASAVLPGLFITGTGPAQANAGSNITYTLRARNGGASAANGVVVEFTIPANTTFQSVSLAGCTTPAVGGTGLVSCPIGALAAGGNSAFTVTVNINPAATGQIVTGLYDVFATGVLPLYGNKIITRIGCAADTDCTGGNWCNITGSACLPKLANGTLLPTDAPHVNPTLNGTCTNAAATLVCSSAVCDTTDNRCGYLNGNGTCNAGNAAVVCRSGVCDANDNHCGYGTGGGPCTSGNASTVCRSGACSVNGTCEPAGGCNVDGDCSNTNWCNETQHTCTPKLQNGSPVPTDPPHQNPTLNGSCTPAAGAVVCTSGVCDTRDNQCGYGNGAGPCTPANATTVCRSGTCGGDGKCMPQGGCNVDADCSGGKWCNETSHVCTDKLANGTKVPSDPPHTNPTLNGKCTPPAGALVCVAGVCDTGDDACGLLNGNGPCTAANGAVVCRSGVCDPDGKCGYAGGGPCDQSNGTNVCRSLVCLPNNTCAGAESCTSDTDCKNGKWCNLGSHLCAPKIENGGAMPNDSAHANPTLDGKCSESAAVLVCVSGVCDRSDDKCGYANGTGPCTQQNGATVCRGGVCGPDGLCTQTEGSGPGATAGAASSLEGGGCSCDAVGAQRGAGVRAGLGVLIALAAIGARRRRR